jgi:hypothetical protein
MDKHRRGHIALFSTLALCALGTTQLAQAENPKPGMRNILGATTAEFTLFEVSPGSEQLFLDELVKSGPYNHQLATLACEKVLAPLPGVSSSYFISVARYYNDTGPADVAEQRDPSLANYLAAPPVHIVGQLVENVLADWGLEHKQTPQITALNKATSHQIFAEKLTTLSFLKTGYTGQAGLVELYPSSTEEGSIRAQLQARAGLSGASIYKLSDGGYAAYSEYFRSPPESTQPHASVIAGSGTIANDFRQGGVVQVNYAPR